MEIFIVSVFDSDQQQALVKYMRFICATQYFSMADVSFDGFILLLLPFFFRTVNFNIVIFWLQKTMRTA